RTPVLAPDNDQTKATRRSLVAFCLPLRVDYADGGFTNLARSSGVWITLQSIESAHGHAWSQSPGDAKERPLRCVRVVVPKYRDGVPLVAICSGSVVVL